MKPVSLEEDYKHFMESLALAGSRISPHYIQPAVTGLDDPNFRERPYCYELYHQLRSVLGDNYEYNLDGELDKKSHPIISKYLGPKKPDFVVHSPGTMNRNLAVVEVKPVTVSKEDLELDLDKLVGFLRRASYNHAVMLIYGDGERELPEWIKEATARRSEQRLVLVWHRKPHEKPTVVNVQPFTLQ